MDKTGKAQTEQMFSGLPPKADLPILELLPAPTLRETPPSRPRARRVAVRRRAVLKSEGGALIVGEMDFGGR